jgi:hypothetical protein
MHFVPIQTSQDELRKLAPLWLPFLPGIAKRSSETVEEMLDSIAAGRVQIGLAWDGERAHALVGMQYRKHNSGLICELIWMTGKNMETWRDLLPEVEQYLREHVHCTDIRPICRPGWSRFLKGRGYRTTHYVMEKKL